MKRIITGLALLAALGSSITAASPVLAQGKIDCSDPRMAMMYCNGKQTPPQKPAPQQGGNFQNRGDQNPPPRPRDNFPDRRDYGPRPQFRPGDNNYFDYNRPEYRGPDYGYRGGPDRNRFFREFRRFEFQPFPFPNFTIRPGYAVPRYYDLRPVPPSLWIYYPAYRGYLFFQTRDGTIVIVNPRTYRIVAIF